MPRYFFNMTNGHAVPDAEGLELPNVQAAKVEAARKMGETLADSAGEFWHEGDWQIDVTDANRLTLFSLTLFGTDAPAIGSAR